MEYRLLGRTGVEVSVLGLGTYNFGHLIEKSEAEKIFKTALDAGCNVVDTANTYGKGSSETCLGEFIPQVRDQVVLCTKAFNRVGPGPNDKGNSALAIIRECERSLRRLKTDHIDIYFLHRHDPNVPAEDILATLTRLVYDGKIRYFGFSTFPTADALATERTGVVRSWRIAEAIALAKNSSLARLACEQLPYNLLEREVERHLLPACAEYGVGAIAYSPLAMGSLSTKSADRSEDVRFDKWFNSQDPEWNEMRLARGKLSTLARDVGLSLEDLAIAWSVQDKTISSVLLGPRTIHQMYNALRVPLELTSDVLSQVDLIVPPGTSLWMRPGEAMHRRRNAENIHKVGEQ